MEEGGIGGRTLVAMQNEILKNIYFIKKAIVEENSAL